MRPARSSGVRQDLARYLTTVTGVAGEHGSGRGVRTRHWEREGEGDDGRERERERERVGGRKRERENEERERDKGARGWRRVCGRYQST